MVDVSTRPVAITMGEPAGIGPEVILALSRIKAANPDALPDFVVIGDPAVFEACAQRLSVAFAPRLLTDFKEFSPGQPADLQIVATRADATHGRPGIPSGNDVPAIIEAIDRATAAAVAGTASAIVTCPINKQSLYAAGFGFPGHTEYLAELAGRADGRTHRPVMMMAGPELRTVPATIHLPVHAVPPALSVELLVQTGDIVLSALRDRFGLTNPRLAVTGLNPHAGEGGSLGTEEIDVIIPAIDDLRGQGHLVTGPHPADTMFHPRARAGYDAILTMYHDQALIPAKMLGFDDTVNLTLGLPFVRTSPDHGTAFDIAGQGIARPDALVAAVRLAARLCKPADRT